MDYFAILLGAWAVVALVAIALINKKNSLDIFK